MYVINNNYVCIVLMWFTIISYICFNDFNYSQDHFFFISWVIISYADFFWNKIYDIIINL